MKKVIGVKFANDDNKLTSKTYSYYTNDPNIKVGNAVVVAVGSRGKEVPTIAFVTQAEGLSKAQIANAKKWIVSTVDLTEYRANQEREDKITEIRNQLHQRKEEMEDLLFYKTLAETDPTMKTLLVELQELDSSVTLIETK
jgi:hypothetical protein